MTPQQLSAFLDPIDPSDSGKLDALAAETVNAARETARSAVKLWADPHAPAARAAKCMEVLGGLEELSIVPLLEDHSSPGPREKAWMLRTITAGAIRLRLQFISRLIQAMADKRLIPEPPTPIRPEGTPPPKRVCDEAYLLARQFGNLAESKMQYLVNEKEFLNWPEDKKDAEIDKFKTSKTWNQFTDDIEK